MALSLGTNSDSLTSDSMVANADLYVTEELIPNVFDSTTVLKMLGGKEMLDMGEDGIEAAGESLELRNGGEVIAINLMTNKGDMTQALDEFEIISVEQPRVAEPSWVDWKEYATPATISRRQLRKNSGSQSHFDLQDAYLKQAEMDIIEKLDIDLVRGDQSESTLASINSKRVHGISYYVEENPESSSTVANVARASNDWHHNRSNLTSDNSISDTPAFDTEGVKDILLLMLEARAGTGSDEVDCFLTNDSIFSYWWDELDDLVRFPSSGPADNLTGDLYREPTFKGRPVYTSKALTGISVENVYGIAKKYFHLVVDRESFFVFDGEQEPYNQLASVSYIIAMLNLICSNPRRSFVLTGITAS
jgi:hypothetical protein